MPLASASLSLMLLTLKEHRLRIHCSSLGFCVVNRSCGQSHCMFTRVAARAPVQQCLQSEPLPVFRRRAARVASRAPVRARCHGRTAVVPLSLARLSVQLLVKLASWLVIVLARLWCC